VNIILSLCAPPLAANDKTSVADDHKTQSPKLVRCLAQKCLKAAANSRLLFLVKAILLLPSCYTVASEFGSFLWRFDALETH
jgi:hypothetical protein